MNSKKMRTTLVAVGLVGIIGASATIAYLTDHVDPVKNVFTVGDVEIDLDEPKWNPETTIDMIPGASVDKNPIVTNTGKIDAFIGVSLVEFKDMIEKDFIVGILKDESNLKLGLNNNMHEEGRADDEVFCWNDNFTLVNADGTAVKTTNQDALTYNEFMALTDNSKLYFAYEHELKVGDQTPALFTGVQLTTAATNKSQYRIVKHFLKDGAIYDPYANGIYKNDEPDKGDDGKYLYKYTIDVVKTAADGTETREPLDSTVYDTYEKALEVAQAQRVDTTEEFDITIQSAAIQSVNDTDPENWEAKRSDVWYPQLDQEYFK